LTFSWARRTVAVLDPPDQAKARPVFVDGGDLHVDQSKRQRDLPDDVVGDIAVMAARPARPGCPDGSVWLYPLGQRRQFGGKSGRGGEERDQHIGGSRSRVAQAGRRVIEVPARWAVRETQQSPRLESEFSGLCHHGAADGFPGGRTSNR
jgi:hypothetical protein